MKRTLSFMLILALGLMILTACGKPDTGSTSGDDNGDEGKSAPEPMTSIPKETIDIDEHRRN